jgi:hypothetical protein
MRAKYNSFVCCNSFSRNLYSVLQNTVNSFRFSSHGDIKYMLLAIADAGFTKLTSTRQIVLNVSN